MQVIIRIDPHKATHTAVAVRAGNGTAHVNNFAT
jgi:hypothetical protein